MGGAELVDHDAFGISRSETFAMDPQQRVVLEHGYAALKHAGLDRSLLGGRITGVFLGIAAMEFDGRSSTARRRVAPCTLQRGRATIASGRLSYVLALNGPCVSYDTACSARALGVPFWPARAAAAGNSAGVVVGVSLMLAPSTSFRSPSPG